jgi:hypothetical protein
MVTFFGRTDTADRPERRRDDVERRPADAASKRRPAQVRTDDGGLSVISLT